MHVHVSSGVRALLSRVQLKESKQLLMVTKSRHYTMVEKEILHMILLRFKWDQMSGYGVLIASAASHNIVAAIMGRLVRASHKFFHQFTAVRCDIDVLGDTLEEDHTPHCRSFIAVLEINRKPARHVHQGVPIILHADGTGLIWEYDL
jgi:hypothetical protein